MVRQHLAEPPAGINLARDRGCTWSPPTRPPAKPSGRGRVSRCIEFVAVLQTTNMGTREVWCA